MVAERISELLGEGAVMEEIYILIKEYLQPELIWFVPCLYVLGHCIKKSIRIDNTLIPNILVLFGIALSGLVGFSRNHPVSWVEWAILVSVSIGQGAVLASLAVCCNQIIKQHFKARSLNCREDNENE